MHKILRLHSFVKLTVCFSDGFSNLGITNECVYQAQLVLMSSEHVVGKHNSGQVKRTITINTSTTSLPPSMGYFLRFLLERLCLYLSHSPFMRESMLKSKCRWILVQIASNFSD